MSNLSNVICSIFSYSVKILYGKTHLLSFRVWPYAILKCWSQPAHLRYEYKWKMNCLWVDTLVERCSLCTELWPSARGGDRDFRILFSEEKHPSLQHCEQNTGPQAGSTPRQDSKHMTEGRVPRGVSSSLKHYWFIKMRGHPKSVPLIESNVWRKEWQLDPLTLL